MKRQVRVGNTIYYVESEDDLVSVTHELARQGIKIEKIAYLLGVSVRKVRQYLESC
ncbi:HTH transcriptional regulator [Sulfolobus islandicus rod-shaped virus 3]|uniref:HTH transcriptional regulator n=1 Tax=Sulfolobus islandicus rod-shaped virus 3 TaxID=2848124 RepID=A0A1B3SMZ7_9VIRU|nr:terminase small subunit [Sulfolobus islandicus rudivirus 3]AOG61561.1 HTH transcriptional regulator [Sulfolobus islandicus rod-shaped virus 3]